MKQNLSTTVNVTSTYAGEFAGKYIMAALLAGKTLGEGNITIKPNVKYKEVVKKLAVSDIIAAATCDFTPIGTVALTERILQPVELQVNLQLCKDSFQNDWDAISMGYSAFDVLPKNFSDFLIANISATVGANMETTIWQHGNNAVTGFTLLFKADTTVLDITGTTISSSNVMAELAKVVAKASTMNTYGSGEKPVIYAATSVVMNYLIALGGFGAAGVGAAGYDAKGPNQTLTNLYYAGIQIIEAPGLASDEMVCTQKSNLWFGTGLMSDYNAVKVIDQADIDGSQNVNFIMRFTAGVQYMNGNEIVYYWK